MASYKVAIIGCGNMGKTYARSFLQYGICLPEELVLVEKSDSRRTLLAPEGLGTVVSGCGPEVGQSNIVVLAVKPQDFAELAPLLKPHLQSDNIVLSIMAGTPISGIREELDHGWSTPSQIAERWLGMTPMRVSNLIAHLGLKGSRAHSKAILNKARGHDRTVISYVHSPAAVALIERELRSRSYRRVDSIED